MKKVIGFCFILLFALNTGIYAQLTPDKILKTAKLMEKQGKYDNAEKLYKFLITKFPNNIEGYLGMGRIYKSKKEYRKSILYLELGNKKADSQKLDYKEGYALLGEVYMKYGLSKIKSDTMAAQRNLVKARGFFELISKDDKIKLIDTLLKRFGLEIAGKEKKPVRAAKPVAVVKKEEKKPVSKEKKIEVKKAEKPKISIDKISITMKLIKIGSIFIEKGEYKRGLEKLYKALQLDTTNQYVYYQIGRAYMKMNKPDSAYYYWRKGWELDKKYIRLSYVLAQYFYDSADTLSQQDLDKAMKYAEDALLCYVNLKDINGIKKTRELISQLKEAKKQREFEELKAKAREKARKALLAKIKSEELRKKLEKQFEAEKRKEEKKIEKKLTYRDYFKMGNRAYKRSQYKTAIKYYKQAIELKKDYGKAYYNMGCANFRLGRYRTAAYYFKKAYRLLDKDPDALYNLVVSYANDADIVSAVYYAEAYIDIFR